MVYIQRQRRQMGEIWSLQEHQKLNRKASAIQKINSSWSDSLWPGLRSLHNTVHQLLWYLRFCFKFFNGLPSWHSWFSGKDEVFPKPMKPGASDWRTDITKAFDFLPSSWTWPSEQLWAPLSWQGWLYLEPKAIAKDRLPFGRCASPLAWLEFLGLVPR
jgi:hypothetical protein